ncbi:MAG: DUF2589 domain-containing protein [Treponema sp.]|nr:DUF2589 domain-containing protein [Treponema sp.]
MEKTGNSGIETVVEMPISELIAAPLEAAVEAQTKLAQSTVDYITEVGFEKNGNRAREMMFTVQRPAEKEGKTEELTIRAPLLALVPVPNLAIEEMNIDFQMEVTSTDKVVEKKQTEGNEEGRIVVAGKVSSNAEHTRETNQSAKYQIQVKARKQAAPEGLSRLLDVLAATVRGYDTEEK